MPSKQISASQKYQPGKIIELVTEPGDGSEERKSRKGDDEAGIVEEIIKSAFDKSLNMLENSSILKEDSVKNR